MAEKLIFQNNLAVQRLTKIMKKVRERKQPMDACQYSNYVFELSEDIRQLKEVIEEVETIAQNLNEKVKTRRSKVAAKTIETQYSKMINEVKTLLFANQKKLKSVKNKQNNLSSSMNTTSLSSKVNVIKGPKLNNDLLNDIFQNVIRKSPNQGTNLTKFMLSGKEAFKVALNYFSLFQFTHAAISGNNLYLTKKEIENIPSKNNLLSDGEELNYEAGEVQPNFGSWTFSSKPLDKWDKKQREFHPNNINEKILEFRDFLLIKPLSLVFTKSIEIIEIKEDPSEQYFLFLNQFSDLKNLNVRNSHCQIFDNYLISLKCVKTLKVEFICDEFNTKIFEEINFEIENLIVDEIPFKAKFPRKFTQNLKNFYLTTILEKDENQDISAKNVLKYLRAFPNTKFYNLAFQMDKNGKHSFNLENSYTDHFKNLLNPNQKLNLRVIIPVKDNNNSVLNTIINSFPGDENKRQKIIKPSENVNLSFEFPIVDSRFYQSRENVDLLKPIPRNFF